MLTHTLDWVANKNNMNWSNVCWLMLRARSTVNTAPALFSCFRYSICDRTNVKKKIQFSKDSHSFVMELQRWLLQQTLFSLEQHQSVTTATQNNFQQNTINSVRLFGIHKSARILCDVTFSMVTCRNISDIFHNVNNCGQQSVPLNEFNVPTANEFQRLGSTLKDIKLEITKGTT